MPQDWKTAFRTAPATLAIAAACIAVFAVKMLVDASGVGRALYYSMSTSVLGVVYGRWWTLATSMFMHGNAAHLLCNLVSLYWMGVSLERLFKTPRFLALYFASGVAGNLFFVAINLMQTPGYNVSAVGASGAIFGLFGTYAVIALIETRRPMLLPRQAARSQLSSMMGLLAINVFISLTPGIAWEAHLGGLVVGTAVGGLMHLSLRHKIAGGGNRGAGAA